MSWGAIGPDGVPEDVGLHSRLETSVDVGASLLAPDYVDRNLHCRNRFSVLEPVCGVPVLWPAHSRPIVRSDSISMVSDRSLQYVDDAWSVLMVVNRAEDASRLDGHHTHSKLAPFHPLDLRAKVNSCKQLRRNTFRLRRRLLVAHRALLSVLPNLDGSVHGLRYAVTGPFIELEVRPRVVTMAGHGEVAEWTKAAPC
jgi:hypothetical protein